MVCSGAIFNYVTMADSGVINSEHEPNSVQSLLQCPFERRTLAEKLKVKELGSDQPDGRERARAFGCVYERERDTDRPTL